MQKQNPTKDDITLERSALVQKRDTKQSQINLSDYEHDFKIKFMDYLRSSHPKHVLSRAEEGRVLAPVLAQTRWSRTALEVTRRLPCLLSNLRSSSTGSNVGTHGDESCAHLPDTPMLPTNANKGEAKERPIGHMFLFLFMIIFYFGATKSHPGSSRRVGRVSGAYDNVSEVNPLWKVSADRFTIASTDPL